MSQPNILFVMADQMSAMAVPCYGHPVVKMPALSRLAAEGVVFENAYCNSPLCGPSRLSMMSGRLPSAVGAYDNASEFAASIPTFAHYLRRLGYLTCLSGKMHFAGPDQLHGYEERLTTDIYPSDFGWTPNWGDPEAMVTFQDMQNVLETGPCARSLQLDYDEEAAYHAVRWIYDQARSEAARPFMLTVSFTQPHDPYVALPEFWDLYDPAEIDLPKVPPIPLDEMDPHSRRVHEHYSVGKAVVTDDVIRRTRQGYYASISYIDAKIAQLMTALERSGQADNTIVIFASDHGDMMGERGMYYKKSFFEWSLRVPLVFWAPGRFAPRRVGEVVSLVDMVATFVNLGGGAPEDILATDGVSIAGLAAGGSDAAGRTIAAEFLAEGVFEPTFMLRAGRWKFCYSEIDPPVLYDMEADPLELDDVAADPEHAGVVEGFRQAARAQWNASDLKARIVEDQDRRRLVQEAHMTGRMPDWDYQPFVDASQQYVRAGKWTVEVEGKAHLDVK
ncbi:MAG: choline-sulfatase [Thermohalobaculum sp.]